MDKEVPKFQICFQSLEDNDRDEICKICNKHTIFSHSQTKGIDGCLQDIVYCVLDTINNADYKDIIIGGALWDLVKFISKVSYSGFITLIINNKKRKYFKVELLIKDLGNYLSKIICNSNTLYGIAEKCVTQYNKEFNENLSLNLNSLFDEKYLQIDIENNTIFINRRIFIYLASYFFGSSKLSHLYKLTWDMILLDYIDEAEALYSKFITEWENKKERVKYFLNINPQWLTHQIYLTLLHELGHHRYKIAPREFEENMMFVRVALTEVIENIETFYDVENELNHLSNLLDGSNEKTTVINFLREFLPELPILYKEIAYELIKDSNFIEELTVDLFAFGHAVGAVLASSDSKLMMANILAALTVNSWYIEYAQRLDTFSINPEASDKKERIALGIVNYIQQSLRVKVREQFILTYLKDISEDNEAMKLYQNLTTSVYRENNGELDIDFLKDLDKYYIKMRSGNNFQTNNFDRDYLELKMETVESEIIKLLSDSLESEHKI